MSYRIGPHILYSRNAHELAHFISEVLDMDIFAKDEGEVLLKNELVAFQIIQAAPAVLMAREIERDMILSFVMDDLKSLEDLLYKVQFLSYRHGESSAADHEKRASLHQQGSEHFFFLKDLDGRRWKFSFNSPT